MFFLLLFFTLVGFRNFILRHVNSSTDRHPKLYGLVCQVNEHSKLCTQKEIIC